MGVSYRGHMLNSLPYKNTLGALVKRSMHIFYPTYIFIYCMIKLLKTFGLPVLFRKIILSFCHFRLVDCLKDILLVLVTIVGQI